MPVASWPRSAEDERSLGWPGVGKGILLEASGAVGCERFAANQGATLWANKTLLALIAGSHEAGSAAKGRGEGEVERDTSVTCSLGLMGHG